jgi:hypothetical protein
VVECLPSLHKALGLIPTQNWKKQKQNKQLNEEKKKKELANLEIKIEL